VGFVGEEALGDEEAFEVTKERFERAVESGRGEGGLICERAEDAVAEFSAAAFEEDGVGDRRGEVILESGNGVGRKGGGEGREDSGDAAVEEEFFAPWAGRRVDSDRRRRGLAGGVVVIGGSVGGEVGGGAGLDVDGIPGDGAFGAFLIEGDVTAKVGGRDRGVGIPLGDEALGKRGVDGDVSFPQGIEIEDGSFHADGAAKAALEIGVLEMLDKRGKVRGTGEGEPVHGEAVGTGDGGEGAPLLDGE